MTGRCECEDQMTRYHEAWANHEREMQAWREDCRHIDTLNEGQPYRLSYKSMPQCLSFYCQHPTPPIYCPDSCPHPARPYPRITYGPDYGKTGADRAFELLFQVVLLWFVLPLVIAGVITLISEWIGRT